MHILRQYRMGVPVVALLALAACGDGPLTRPPAAKSGTLAVVLNSPARDDGAAVFTLRGSHIGEVSAADPANVVFARRLDETTVRVVVVGDRLSGTLVLFEVPDVNKAPTYTASLVQVASRSNALRPSLAGYELAVGTPGGEGPLFAAPVTGGDVARGP